MSQGYISAQTSSNFALKRHLQSKHSKDDCNQFDKIIWNYINFCFKAEWFIAAEALKHQACKVGQEDIDKSVVNLIMGAGLHFSFVKKYVFPDFARKLQPGRTYIQNFVAACFVE